jgi:riboflavin kinase/FMN adenylyltransferase
LLKLLRGISNLPKDFPGCVATIGNFDGVHLGHQQVVAQLAQLAQAYRLPSVLITFEPQPNEFFAHGGAIPARLMRWREKWTALTALQLDYVLCLRFNQTMADLSAADFIEKILVQRLKAAHVLVGDDFRFGHQRAGDIALLQEQGQRWGFSASSTPSYQLAGQRVSSSQVRRALQQNDLTLANTLLGRPYGMFGRIVHGQKRGRMIGFPTANIFLHRRAVPISGVYVVKAMLLPITANPQMLQGVANIGNRPTVDGTRSLLEVHLFDFNQDIYGQHIYVEFVHKLREEKRFDSFELLQQQIILDAEQARKYFIA